jgi:hypothetical protein
MAARPEGASQALTRTVHDVELRRPAVCRNVPEYEHEETIGQATSTKAQEDQLTLNDPGQENIH